MATCPNLQRLLLGGQDNALPTFGITRLVQDEHPGRMRSQIRMRLPEFQALGIDRLNIPRGIMHKVMQPLALGPRNQGRQLDQRFVVLSWQQESDEIVAEGLPFLPSGEQG